MNCGTSFTSIANANQNVLGNLNSALEQQCNFSNLEEGKGVTYFQMLRGALDGVKREGANFSLSKFISENLDSRIAAAMALVSKDPKHALSLDNLYKKLVGQGGGDMRSVFSADEANSLDMSPGDNTPRCPELRFDIYNFIARGDRPVITPQKRANIQRVYDEILVPIVDYYTTKFAEQGINFGGSCILSIINGLVSQDKSSSLSATEASQHLNGTAVDFLINGIDRMEVIDDIRAGRIPIRYGVLAPTNGVHISLPYMIDGEEITNVYVNSLDGSTKRIDVQF